MITPEIIRTGATMALVLSITIGNLHAGCNAPNNQGEYTIEITGGSEDLEDGGSSTYTCTMTPSVSGVTPEWSWDPAGGGAEGLVEPSITENGNSATIQFFWHADQDEAEPTCTYELECKTSEDCIVTKTITITVPDQAVTTIGAATTVNFTVSNGLYRVSTYSSVTTAERADLSDFANSEFLTKITDHENVHYDDFHQGSQTPAALESTRLIGEFLSDTGNDTTPMIQSAFVMLRELTWEYVYAELLDPELRYGWREDRAYDVSDLVPPFYLFQQ